MSTTEIATTVDTVVVTPEAAEAAAEVAARAKRFTAAVKAAEKNIRVVLDTIIQMIANKDHLASTDPTTGRAFTSFAAYLESLASAGAFPLMHTVLRAQLHDEMLVQGVKLSKRELAALTHVGEATATKDRQEAEQRAEAKKRAARPNDGVQVSEQEKAQAEAAKQAEAAARAAKGVSRSLQVADGLAHLMTDQELSKLISESADFNTRIAKLLVLRSQGEASVTGADNETLLERQAIADAIADEKAEHESASVG